MPSEDTNSDDGLTDAERNEYAERWLSGVGARLSKEEMDLALQALRRTKERDE